MVMDEKLLLFDEAGDTQEAFILNERLPIFDGVLERNPHQKSKLCYFYGSKERPTKAAEELSFMEKWIPFIWINPSIS